MNDDYILHYYFQLTTDNSKCKLAESIEKLTD